MTEVHDPNRATLRGAGFTLVEVLVVIAILAVLGGLLVPTVLRAQRQGRVKQAEYDITGLKVAIESYVTDFGDFPPTRLSDDFDISSNGVNEGIESLLAHLCSKRKSGPYFEPREEQIENLDVDAIGLAEVVERLDWLFGDNQLREIVDPFGNPYVYIHNRDYEEKFSMSRIADDGSTSTTMVSGGISAKTSAFYSPTTYQIWSFGANRENEIGTDGADPESRDDLGSW